jgi:hypothetical protein
MMIRAVWIEHPLDVSVQRPQHGDPREHRRAAEIDDKDQRVSIAACRCDVEWTAFGSFAIRRQRTILE